jgi:hypothetical protein
LLLTEEPEGLSSSRLSELLGRDREDIVNVVRSDQRFERVGAGPGTRWRLRTTEKGLPPDIERVWGEGRVDSQGDLAASTARVLIRTWGEEEFRQSAIHKAALAQIEFARRKEATVLAALRSAVK